LGFGRVSRWFWQNDKFFKLAASGGRSVQAMRTARKDALVQLGLGIAIRMVDRKKEHFSGKGTAGGSWILCSFLALLVNPLKNTRKSGGSCLSGGEEGHY